MAKGKFIFGAMVGALLGLAFAPKKGSELRKEFETELANGGKAENILKKNAAIIGEDISKTAQEVYHNPAVQKQITKSKAEAGKLVDNAQKTLSDSGNEWVQIASKKFIQGKKKLEKEVNKTIDSFKKNFPHQSSKQKASQPKKPANTSTKNKKS